ncbi:MAG: Cna B-type domain-containing protein [Lachnospiraceae bacterium]|nr:Cna B-type domain-containing protein [Lachnospiraceae bacterium]
MKALRINSKKRLQKWMGMLVMLCICLVLAVNAAAAGSGTIQITQTDTQTRAAVAGIKLTIYQIAEVSYETASGFAMKEEYASLGIEPDKLGEAGAAERAAEELNSLIEKKQLTGMRTLTTGTDGKVLFDELQDGIYLIRQTNTAEDFEKLGYTYKTEAYLVSLPRTGENGSQNSRSIECHPKGSLLTEDPAQLVVYKVWKDSNDRYGKRPGEITVGLYRNDTLEEEVKLSAVNNWHYEWDSLDADGNWSVKELDIPDGYTSEITTEGTAVTITNTYEVPTVTPTVTPTPKKPKTTPTPKKPKTTPTPSGGKEKAVSPKTGDSSMVSLWIGLAAVSAGMMWLLIGKKKKDRRRN